MIALTDQQPERLLLAWNVLTSEVVTTNEGRTVRRTVLANSRGEMQVRIEPIPADSGPEPDSYI